MRAKVCPKYAYLAVSTALAVALAACDLSIGEVHVSLLHPDPTGLAVLLRIRLPRMLTAVLAGASLALSGLQMQTVFRNPITDPHIMGISGGASLGAALAITAVGAGTALTVCSALAGAVLAAAIVIAASRKVEDSGTLLIFGVMLGFIFSALVSVIEYGASEQGLKLFYSWSSGSFSSNGSAGLICMAAALAAGAVLAFCSRHGLDAILFGDGYAAMCGVEPRRVRALAMTGCCLMTGVATAFCGPLGFVGIVSPHITRRVLGSSVHGSVIPCCLMTGAVIALCADILSQLARARVPVGSTMALIGIPVIIYILFRSRHD